MSFSGDDFREETQERLAAAGLSDDLIRVEITSFLPLLATIDYLYTRDPANWGKGIGRKALSVLTQLADEHDFALEVIPRNINGPMSDKDLKAWYERNGFRRVGSVDTPNLMRREPKSRT